MESSEPARVSFNLDRDTHIELNGLMPWGLKAHVYRILTELFIKAIKKHGDIFLAALLSGNIEFTVSDKGDQILNGSDGQ